MIRIMERRRFKCKRDYAVSVRLIMPHHVYCPCGPKTAKADIKLYNISGNLNKGHDKSIRRA